MNSFFSRWVSTTVAVAIATQVTGMRCEGIVPLLTVALLLGVINASVKPTLLLLSLPFIVFSLGFSILVLNGLLLWLVGAVVPGFYVNGFWQAFFGSMIISVISWGLNGFFRGNEDRDERIHSEEASVRAGEKTVQGRVLK